MLPTTFILDSEQLAKDLNKNELLKKELTIFAGYLAFKSERLLALYLMLLRTSNYDKKNKNVTVLN